MSTEVGTAGAGVSLTNNCPAENDVNFSDHDDLTVVNDATYAPPTEEERVSYLKEVLSHQMQMYGQEEEQCAFLASMLLRSSFKNVTETAFYSAFRKKNIHPDEIGKPRKPSSSSSARETGPGDNDPAAKKAKLQAALEEKREGVKQSLKRKHQQSSGGKDTATGSSSGMAKKDVQGDTEKQAQGSAPAASGLKTKKQKAAMVTNRQVMKHRESKKRAKEVKKAISSTPSSSTSTAAVDKEKASTKAGEAARLLGERLLQQLASSGSSASSLPPAHLVAQTPITEPAHPSAPPVPSSVPATGANSEFDRGDKATTGGDNDDDPVVE